MLGDLVLVLLLVSAPSVILVHWPGVVPTPSVRRVVTAVVIVAPVVLRFPSGGFMLPELQRGTLLVTSGASLLLAVRQLGVPRESEVFRTGLLTTTAAAVLMYLNGFAFHGPGTRFEHVHDVAHYAPGSKYADVVGYARFYDTVLRAEVEDGGDPNARRVRDLESNRIVAAASRIALGEEVKQRFAPERWAEYVADVRAFRARFGPDYDRFLQDYGYNPPPTWSLVGSLVTRWVPLTTDAGLHVLAAFDVVLYGVVAIAIGWTFGLEALAWVAIYLGIAFGCGFGWTGGSFLRQMWFASVVGFAVALRSGRPAVAGSLLAIATMLRVFPGAFAAALALRALPIAWRERWPRDEDVRFFVAFAGACVVFFAATAFFPGLGAWSEFLANISRQTKVTAENTIGLGQASGLLAGIEIGGPGWLEELRRWRVATNGAVVGFSLPLAMVLLWKKNRTLGALQAAAAGTLLVLCGLNLSAYYASFMVLVVLAMHDAPAKLLWVFLAELGLDVLQLFDLPDATIYLAKTWLILYALIAIYGLPDSVGGRSKDVSPSVAT